MRAPRVNGLSVPGDVAMASCEYFPGSEYFIPRITPVNHKNDEIGQQVIRQMMTLLQDMLPEAHTITPVLVAGESA